MRPRTLKILLLSAVLLLLVLNTYLLWQNNHYRRHNHTLILQNDSILSVNLELMQDARNMQATVQAEH